MSASAPTPESVRAMEPRVVPRPEHSISRKKIDPNALKVMYRLHRAGYKGYLVGGGVRDLILGRRPKDFDIATDARPGQVKALFRNSRVIGRRFKLVQVFFRDGTTVEVSTFRSLSEFNDEAPQPGDENGGLLITRDNTYGSPGEDAHRRDLTINGLFYDIATFSILDYVGGLEDLESGVIRVIGDPDIRFQEDPVRMIRAIRHSARTGFEIEATTRAMIVEHAHRLLECPSARVLDEFYRDMRGGSATPAMRLMLETGVLGVLLPELSTFLKEDGSERVSFFWACLEALDRAVEFGDTPQNAVLWTTVFGALIKHELADEGIAEPGDARAIARAGAWIQERFRVLTERFGVGRKEAERLKLILAAEARIAHGLDSGRLPKTLVTRPYFEDALAYFELVSRADGQEVPGWVLKGQTELPGKAAPAKRPRRRRRRRPEDGEGEAAAGAAADGATQGAAGEERPDAASDEGAPARPARKRRRPRRRRRRPATGEAGSDGASEGTDGGGS